MKTKAGLSQKMIALVAILFFITLRSFGQTDQNNTTKVDSGYALVNGLKMYYEIHGNGEPLVLIHGGVGAIEMFGANLTALAQTHKVIAVDLQAHGRTADIDRPLRCDLMADDIAALLKYLKIDKADVMGYSLGGEVALRTAIQHPEAVHKLVVVSATFKRDGWYPEILAGMSQMGPAAAEPMKQTPMYQMYAQLAPRPQDWSVLITKLGDLLKQDYNWSEDVKKIKIPTLIVVGDADAVRTSHAVEFFGLLGGGQRDAGWDGSGRPKNCELAILPGLTHYTIFNAHALASTAIPFLDKN